MSDSVKRHDLKRISNDRNLLVQLSSLRSAKGALRVAVVRITTEPVKSGF